MAKAMAMILFVIGHEQNVAYNKKRWRTTAGHREALSSLVGLEYPQTVCCSSGIYYLFSSITKRENQPSAGSYGYVPD